MHPEVETKLNSYPDDVRDRLLFLRDLILTVAADTDGVAELVETTKWNQPSYTTKTGSTIRIDWDPRTPDRYRMFFHCQSRLIPTFKLLYEDWFTFEGSRAIVFDRHGSVPVEQLKHCISIALLYHTIKKEPLLGTM